MSKAGFQQMVLWAASVMALACAAPQPEDAASGGNMALELRNMILSSKVEEVSPADRNPAVVIMDLHEGDGITSVMSSSGGDASLYLSSGGGMIGGGGQPNVRKAALVFAAEAVKHKAGMSPAADFPYPAAGKVRFYLRTREGAFFLEAPESELAAGTHPLSGLFRAGQEVITQYRRDSPQG